MARLHLEMDEDELRHLVAKHFSSILGVEVDFDRVDIQVKSKQNYKSEWERAAFKAVINQEVK